MTIWARNVASITLNNESSMSPIYWYRAAGVHVRTCSDHCQEGDVDIAEAES